MSDSIAFTETGPMAEAKPPSRSTGSMTLSWGLLSIPLSVFNGSQATYVARKEFVDGKPENPAGRTIIDKSTGEMVDRSRIVSAAQSVAVEAASWMRPLNPSGRPRGITRPRRSQRGVLRSAGRPRGNHEPDSGRGQCRRPLRRLARGTPSWFVLVGLAVFSRRRAGSCRRRTRRC